MFSDTITFTDIHGTTDYVLNRIRQDVYSSEYLLITDLLEVRLAIRNTTRFDKGRNVSIDRHNVEVVETVYPVAPATLSIVRKAFFTFEVQKGDVIATSTEVAKALVGWCSASTYANLVKMANFES